MMQWESELLKLEESKLDLLIDYWYEITEGYELTESGIYELKVMIKKYPVDEIVKAMKISAIQYLKFNAKKDDYTHESLEKCWSKISGIAKMNISGNYDEDFGKIKYVRGILRNKFNKDLDYAESLMRRAKKFNLDFNSLIEYTKNCSNRSEWENTMIAFIEKNEGDDE